MGNQNDRSPNYSQLTPSQELTHEVNICTQTCFVDNFFCSRQGQVTQKKQVAFSSCYEQKIHMLDILQTPSFL